MSGFTISEVRMANAMLLNLNRRSLLAVMVSGGDLGDDRFDGMR